MTAESKKELPEGKLLLIIEEIEKTETTFLTNIDKLCKLLVKENLKGLNIKDRAMLQFFLLPYQAILNQIGQNSFPKIPKKQPINARLHAVSTWMKKINSTPFITGAKNFEAFQKLLGRVFNQNMGSQNYYSKITIAGQFPKNSDLSKELSNFMIQIIQRYPRYILLIVQLREKTKGHPIETDLLKTEEFLKKNGQTIDISIEQGTQQLPPEFVFECIKEELTEAKKIPRDLVSLINTSKTCDQLLHTLKDGQDGCQDKSYKAFLTSLKSLYEEIMKPEETLDEKNAKNSIKTELGTQTDGLIKQIKQSPHLAKSSILQNCLSLLNNQMTATSFLEKYMATEIDDMPPEISTILAETVNIAATKNTLAKITFVQPNRSEAERKQEQQLHRLTEERERLKRELEEIRKQLTLQLTLKEEAGKQLGEPKPPTEEPKIEIGIEENKHIKEESERLKQKLEEAERRLVEESERLKQQSEETQRQLIEESERLKQQSEETQRQLIEESGRLKQQLEETRLALEAKKQQPTQSSSYQSMMETILGVAPTPAISDNKEIQQTLTAAPLEENPLLTQTPNKAEPPKPSKVLIEQAEGEPNKIHQVYNGGEITVTFVQEAESEKLNLF